ncbi:MAG: putative GTP-binding protein EngB [Rhodocyclaceae bacterium]|nr:putative GTP-binding protein EngB [Rhodocyclaceae bacterium]
MFRRRQFCPMSLFVNAVFAISAEKLSDLPPPAGAEIAFAGRSNAGKSSAINTLAGRTRLAFVSKTPGRTQLINYFRLRNGAFMVDLPGYGYADVPDKVRRHWQSVLSAYLTRRESICGLVLIMDARRPLTDMDRQMLEWFGPTGKPIHILLTKADKLTRSEAASVLRATRDELAPWADQVSVQLFSSLKKNGVEEAEKVIGGWLGSAAADE